MSKRISALVLCFLMLLSVARAADKSPPDLTSADWSVKARPNLRDHSSTTEAVYLFLNNLLAPDSRPSQESMASTLGDNNGHVCSFAFSNLHHSGTLSLIALYYSGGTHACNAFSVFDKAANGIEQYAYAGNPVDWEFIDIAKDIEGNGTVELVLRSYDATAHEYDWPVVYAWTGAGYTNVSSQHPRYYQDWLTTLKGEIAAEEKEHKAQTKPDLYLDAEIAEAAKIERYFGSEDAGMTDAIRWSTSFDPEERKLAAQVLADIATSDALIYEKTLSGGTDIKVAELARRRIESWGYEDPYDQELGFERHQPDKQ